MTKIAKIVPTGAPRYATGHASRQIEHAARVYCRVHYGPRQYQIRRVNNRPNDPYDRDYIVYRKYTPNDGGRVFWAFGGYLDEVGREALHDMTWGYLPQD